MASVQAVRPRVYGTMAANGGASFNCHWCIYFPIDEGARKPGTPAVGLVAALPRLPRSCESAARGTGSWEGEPSRAQRPRQHRESEGEGEELPLHWMDGRDDPSTCFGRRTRVPRRPSNTRRLLPRGAPPLHHPCRSPRNRSIDLQQSEHPIGRLMEFFAGRGVAAAACDGEGGGSRFPEPPQHGVWWFCFLADNTGEILSSSSPSLRTRSCYDLC